MSQLAQGQPSREQQVGYVDLVSERTVHGWAWDPERPLERLQLWVEIDGALVGTVCADVFRPDLLDASVGDGAHAFAFPIPDTVKEVGTVTVRFDDMTPVAKSVGFTADAVGEAAVGGWRPGPACQHPSFFVLGAAKCGTTSLHDYLAQHSDICMSSPKEPFYFEAEQLRGAGWYRSRYFAHWRGEPIVGESRHRNLYLPWVPERIWRHAPRARLVAIVRDPVERLISHWWHWYSRGLEPLGLSDAVDADMRRIEAGLRYRTAYERALYRRTLAHDGKGIYRSYVDSGYYAEQLTRFVERFGPEQLLVLRFEELTERPHDVVARTLRFIGADPADADSFSYPHRNRSQPGAQQHVDAALRTRLQEHYAPHERALERLLATLPR